MSNSESFSISQVSKLAGVSVKTLHFYDHKGLLVPMRDPNNGYRCYSHKHLVLLQQILIYRELDFSIEDIKQLINADEDALLTALEKQKQLLIQRQQTINNMLNSIEVTMDNLTNDKLKNETTNKVTSILFKDIPKEKAERWDKLARDRLGDETVDNNISLVANLQEDTLLEIKRENVELSKAFANTIGQAVDSEQVLDIVKAHYQSLNKMRRLLRQEESEVTDVTYEQYVNFANSLDNPEVQEMCEHYGEGYAEHSRNAMLYFAENFLK